MGVPGDTPGGLGESHDASAGRRTSVSVLVQDRLAEIVITAGGLGVVLAMLGICVFLVVSAAPLFEGGRVEGELARFEFGDADPAWVSIDPSFGRFVTLGRDGVFRVRSLGSGEVMASAPAVEGGERPIATRGESGSNLLTLTFGGGRFEIVEPDLTWTPANEPVELGGHQYIEAMADGTSREWTLGVRRLGPFSAGEGALAVDTRGADERERHVVVQTGEGVRVGLLRGRRGLGQDSVRYSLRMDDEPVMTGPVERAYASASGRWVFVLEDRGLVVFDRDAADDGPSRVVFEDPITSAAMALGSETLIVGDAGGELTAWTGDDVAVRGEPTMRHAFGSGAITSIRPGDRDRTVVLGFEDGSVVMTNTLSDKVIARFDAGGPAGSGSGSDGGGGLMLAAASPASDIVMIATGDGETAVWEVEPGHTESSFHALFGKVKYEGYEEPGYVYQSTGSAGTEPKFSLMPLIFGTIKATVVAMLFAAPLAVLAAVYSSEFLDYGVRRYFKPTIELMASLPSVVLGFMAAMVVAPFVRDHLPAVLVVGATAPLAVVLCAHAWRMIPRERRVRYGAGVQFVVIVLAVALGLGLAVVGGGAVEQVLFSPAEGPASIRGWLNGDFGGATPGWVVLLLLPVVGVVLILDSTVLSPVWRRLDHQTGALTRNLIELARLGANIAVSLAATLGLASLLASAGLDARDSVFGPFSQRNTLVVGVIMGIAVIPIIYTISEDAIRSVPDSLRSASLGVGATPWQTALRVVLPVAGSGVFSAIMIGLGRAVGETMIVLMATGNTPEMSWNIFSGFRTLAANIAVELPEAPRGSTHYRVLFLCGLVLFAMTLVINTTAELVRQHFRKRNASL